MSGAQAATIGKDLISRINRLRVMHSSNWGATLDQIEWKARGLERADRSGYLAVLSMVAALKGDQAVLLASADEIEQRFPHHETDRLNALRSLCIARRSVEAKAYAIRFVDEQFQGDYVSTDVVSTAGWCMATLGEAQLGAAIARKFFQSRRSAEEEISFEILTLHHLVELGDALEKDGVSDLELGALIDATLKALAEQGWAHPGIQVTPSIARDATGPSAVLAMYIDTDEDCQRALEVEEAVMTTLCGNRLFSELQVVVSINAIETASISQAECA